MSQLQYFVPELSGLCEEGRGGRGRGRDGVFCWEMVHFRREAREEKFIVPYWVFSKQNIF